MDLGLEQLWSTIAIGAYFLTIFAVLASLGCHYKLRKLAEFEFKDKNIGMMVFSVSLLSLCYIIGLFLEDSDEYRVWPLTYILDPASKYSTVEVFIEPSNTKPEHKYTSFAKFYAENGLISKIRNCSEFVALENSINNNSLIEDYSLEKAIDADTCLVTDPDQLSDIAPMINDIYYHSKNTVYQTDNYYDEMKQYEQRRAFARAMSATSIFHMIFSVVVVFIVLGRAMHFLYCREDKNLFRQSLVNLLLVFLVLAASALVFFVSRQVDRCTWKDHTLRVFGYYRSIHVEEEVVGRKLR